MLCRKCKQEIQETSLFCNFCGTKQEVTKRSSKGRTRGNGEGTAYQRGKTWTARIILGWWLDENMNAHPHIRTKGGFATKKEALAYIPELKASTSSDLDPRITFQQLYLKWYPTHERKVSSSTMDCYKAAFKHYRDLWGIPFKSLGIDDLQACLDECPAGRRTRENMKAVGTLLYKYAASRRLINDNENTAQYLYLGSDTKGTRPSFTPEQVEKIRNAIGKIPYADYVYCMIYTGFRPNEMLSLTRDAYRKEGDIEYLVGGFKSEAGTNRTVPISPKIRPIILPLLMKADPWLFPKHDGKMMDDRYFRETCFYPLLSALGIQRIPDANHPAYYVPYSCRHTFSNLIKAVKGNEKDKSSLMGHTDPKMTLQYQDSKLPELKAITDAI